jgi:glycosyltransferase involved in cell wall biosynthesis
MKLLIVTQKVDINDPILGFFHRWIVKLSERFENIIVICLEMGKYDFPKNIKVLSLGKEVGISRAKYAINFYRYIWRFRREYDIVFIHMNQEYVLLGGVFWKIIGKRISLWRNHKSGGILTYLAAMISDRIFYTSPDSFTARFSNAIKMPVGIDQSFFTNTIKVNRIARSFLYVGRISQIKNIDVMIAGLSLFHKNNPAEDFVFTVVGPVNSESDRKYKSELLRLVDHEGLSSHVRFEEAVMPSELLRIYYNHVFCFNLTDSGSFDKTILESVACGCIPIVYNVSFLDLVPEELRSIIGIQNLNPINVASVIQKLIITDNFNNISSRLLPLAKKNSLDVLLEELYSNI